MRFVVYGAGAVGGVIGGHLALQRHDVLLICRADHAKVIQDQNGLRMKSGTGEYFAELQAAAIAERSHFDDRTCVILTAKSNHTKACVEQLSKVTALRTPIVSFQNGVSNEEIITGKFEDVYGGVIMMTCSFLHAGQVSFRRIGRLIVGKYPKGANAFAKKLGGFFDKSGFDASVSNSIMCDKWLKLVVNLQSAYHAITDMRDHDSLEFTRLKVGVLEEARKVLKAAKIRAKPCDGRDFSLDERIDELKKPRASRATSAVRVNNSTWQNLYLKRDEIENSYFHGPIIELGKEHSIRVPYNEVALKWVSHCSEKKLEPNTLRATDLLAEVEGRSGQV